MSTFAHTTVLLEPTVDFVLPRSGGIYVDCTLGGGGHTEHLLERSAPEGRVIGIDRDPRALEAASERLARFGARFTPVHDDFGAIKRVLASLSIPRVDGVIADVGVSSPQLDDASRGFSFMNEGPLDMRMDTTRGETVLELIERLDANELADVIYELGEERKSRRIARSIREAFEAGSLETTSDLASAVRRAMGGPRGKIDPATRTFQALRIAVNRELAELSSLVQAAGDVLVDDGIVAIIAFHSLEDRIVKRAFRDDVRLVACTKKPVIADDDEAKRNPRARSAKLRAARRVPREVAE
jgi:16S rRNA (cytosine1402-N4)-methyltransferase